MVVPDPKVPVGRSCRTPGRPNRMTRARRRRPWQSLGNLWADWAALGGRAQRCDQVECDSATSGRPVWIAYGSVGWGSSPRSRSRPSAESAPRPDLTPKTAPVGSPSRGLQRLGSLPVLGRLVRLRPRARRCPCHRPEGHVTCWVRLHRNDVPVLWRNDGRTHNADFNVVDADGTHASA
jgi:hypothetical protein